MMREILFTLIEILFTLIVFWSGLWFGGISNPWQIKVDAAIQICEENYTACTAYVVAEPEGE